MTATAIAPRRHPMTHPNMSRATVRGTPIP
jgi:hypothetical protein